MPRSFALLIALLLLSLAPAARAQTCTTAWAAAVDGDWSDAAKWTAGVPEATDAACVTADGTYTVAIGRSAAPVASLTIGGASGTQTVTSLANLEVGDAVIGPNGRLELLNRTPGGTDGLYATGTVLVEGLLQAVAGTSLLETGGVLDVAPGGTLRVSGNGVGAGGPAARFRIRGLLEAVGCPLSSSSGSCQVQAPLDVQGGTIRAAEGVLILGGAGTFHDATVDAVAGATLRLDDASVSGGGLLTVTGTLSGTPAGDVVVSTLRRFAAGPGDAVLAVGGTGLRITSSTGLAFTEVTSTGGRFVNTGLLVWDDDLNRFGQVVLVNRGLFRINWTMSFQRGAVLRNEPGHTVELNRAGMGGTGRFENAGLLLHAGPSGNVGLGGLLRSLPGSEIRVNTSRLDLAAPAALSLPDGVTLTGTGRVGIPRELQIEGTVSPGTEATPLTRLEVQSAFIPSQVTGSPRLVVDVDAGGRSDTLDVLFSSGSVNVRLAGALVVRVRPGYTPAVGDSFTVMTSAREITGRFAQVVAENAPEGIAFVAETRASPHRVVVRAVEVAPDGPITVSDTRPVGGAVRSLFLTGPGAAGVAAVRLECRECLDPDSLGTIPGTLVGAGTLREARFDLTSPRIFGLFDLVVERAGLAAERLPITVRPYVSYIQSFPVVSRGIRVRPSGMGYNWSVYQTYNTTNVDEPAYSFGVVGPEDPEQVVFALATPNPLGGGKVFFESEAATGDGSATLTFARIPPLGPVNLTYGLRMDPSEVLFPEQAPTGPDDPRIPFGEGRLFSTFNVQHTSFARAAEVVEAALRHARHDGLRAYAATVDAAGAGALRGAVAQSLQSQPRYVGGVAALLRQLLAEMDAVVPAPAGLAEQALPGFERTLDIVAYRLYADLEYAYRIDLAAAPPAVQQLFADEHAALSYGEAGKALFGGVGGSCQALVDEMAQKARLRQALLNYSLTVNPPAPTEVDLNNAVQCEIQEDPPPPPTLIDPNDPRYDSPQEQLIKGIGNTIQKATRSNFFKGSSDAPAPKTLRSGAGTCSPGGGGGAGGGGGGGSTCQPPSAPADPNDKSSPPSDLCEIGTVTVDHEEVTRCVRHFIPLADVEKSLQYTIDFENLPQATASAEFVTITDTLDAGLDPRTLEVYATSSDSTFSYDVSGQVVTFRFVGIDLPPNRTAPEGQGFVTFGVSLRDGLPEGTVVENDASIVFDFNPAIATPAVVHEIRRAADVSAVISAPERFIAGAPVSFDVVVTNIQGDEAADVSVTITTGTPVLSAVPTGGTCTGAGPVTCTFGTLPPATYERITITVQPEPGTYTLSAATATSAFDAFAPNDHDAVSVGVSGVGSEDMEAPLRELTLVQPYPNPVRGALTLRWGLPEAGHVDVRLYDLLGREVARLADAPSGAGWHEVQWEADVASGVYVVRLAVGQQVRTQKILVVH